MGYASLYENISDRSGPGDRSGPSDEPPWAKRKRRGKPKITTTQPFKVQKARIVRSASLTWQMQKIVELQNEVRRLQILNADLKRALRQSREEVADWRGVSHKSSGYPKTRVRPSRKKHR